MSTPAARTAPLAQLPATGGELAAGAAAVLGWPGVVLPESTVLGRRVCLVVRMRMAAHAERIAAGVGPMLDRATVDTWTWPELARTAPPAAVEILGVIATARHWRTGMAAAVPFARYGDAALVLPAAAVLSRDYLDNGLPRARSFGLGVVTADTDGALSLDLSCHDERLLADEDPVSRWVNELAYQQLLATADDPAPVD